MSRTGIVLLEVGVLLTVCQWAWLRVANHLDPRRLPAHSRRRVAWLQANSTHIELAGLGVVAAVLLASAASLL